MTEVQAIMLLNDTVSSLGGFLLMMILVHGLLTTPLLHGIGDKS